MTLIRLAGYPYPRHESRVLPGTDKGTNFLSEGYPRHSLSDGDTFGVFLMHTQVRSTAMIHVTE